MKLSALFLLILSMVLCSYDISPRTYELPNVPYEVAKEYGSYWIKKYSENAINNTNSISYDNIAGFTYYFFNYQKEMTEISNNSFLSNKIYDWAKPYIVDKINTLSEDEKIKLYSNLSYALNYIKNFNFIEEEKYLTANSYLFTYCGPAEYFDNEYNQPYPWELIESDRSLEAFIFRRLRGGLNRKTLEKFIEDILSKINVNYQKKIIVLDDDDNKICEYTWQYTHYEKKYVEYGFVKAYGENKPYTRISGQYVNGKKDGLWLYYDIEGIIPYLSHSIEYNLGKPIKYTQKSFREIEVLHKGKIKYKFISELNIPLRLLNITVFDKNEQIASYNSDDDYIDFWDIYGSERLIAGVLSTPNLDIPLKNVFTESDKPKVKRNEKTKNYVLYDELKRDGKDHALFFATSTYNDSSAFPNLRNPIRDAEIIASNLNFYFGFNTEIIKNPTKTTFFSILNDYKKIEYEKDEQLLIYITGHGKYIDGMESGFLIPKDGKSQYKDLSHVSWISYKELLDALSDIKCDHIFLLIDACNSGALQLVVEKMKNIEDDIGSRLNPGIKIWYFNGINKKSKMYITSTSSDRSVSDGINHSPFTTMFIRSLQSITSAGPEYIIDIKNVYDYMRNLQPKPELKPLSGNDENGSFFFVLK